MVTSIDVNNGFYLHPFNQWTKHWSDRCSSGMVIISLSYLLTDSSQWCCIITYNIWNLWLFNCLSKNSLGHGLWFSFFKHILQQIILQRLHPDVTGYLLCRSQYIESLIGFSSIHSEGVIVSCFGYSPSCTCEQVIKTFSDWLDINVGKTDWEVTFLICRSCLLVEQGRTTWIQSDSVWKVLVVS